jgi:hypothetical protein
MDFKTLRLENEMNLIVKNNQKSLVENTSYVVIVEFLENIEPEPPLVIDSIFKMDNRPSCIYHHKDTLILIYPADSKLFLEGDYYKIISFYSQFINRLYDINVEVSVLGLGTNIRTFIYLAHRVLKNMLECMSFHLEKEVDIRNITIHEVIQKLEKKGVDWDDLSSNERFGTFFRTSRKSRKILELSEQIDMRDKEKYSTFIFGE